MSYANKSSSNFHDFSYYTTNELNKSICVTILELEGKLLNEQKTKGRMMLEAALKKKDDKQYKFVSNEDNIELYVTAQLWTDGMPLCLPIQTSYKPLHVKREWNETIVFPVKYKDLSFNSLLAITVWEYDKDSKLHVFGGNCLPFFTKNNKFKEGKRRLNLVTGSTADPLNYSFSSNTKNKVELDKIEKKLKKLDNNELPKLDWLDKISLNEIDRLKKEYTEEMVEPFITFELETFDFPLVWSETENLGSTIDLTDYEDICYIFDPEINAENLSETKYRKLVRGNFFGSIDKDLKPSSNTRNTLNNILKYSPSREMTDYEKNLIWRFRYFLSNNRNAMGKFVQSVDWKDKKESTQALELLEQWRSDIGIEQVLELFCPHVNQNSTKVWDFAVSALKLVDEQKILLYLLQIVQAVRFEPKSQTKHHGSSSTNKISSSNHTSLHETVDHSTAKNKNKAIGKLAAFLIQKSLLSDDICHRFYWYLMVECENKEFGKLYGRIAYQLMSSMTMTSNGSAKRQVLRKQSDLILKMTKISTEIAKSKEPRPRKMEILANYLNDEKNELLNFPPLPHPLDPKVLVTGIIPNKAMVFKSAMSPLLLCFRTLEDDGSVGEYKIIFKSGDDMRQDQLVLQVIEVMDNLLQKESLDLRLVRYNVLATGLNQGMVEFVPSMSLAAILAENQNKIINFLQKIWSASSAEYLPESIAMENYVRSCAGYCVITYLLGVGDRHLDNLLLTNSGKLFHVDYGYILGNDPKPFPPPIKLCKEMVEAMNTVPTAAPNNQYSNTYNNGGFSNSERTNSPGLAPVYSPGSALSYTPISTFAPSPTPTAGQGQGQGQGLGPNQASRSRQGSNTMQSTPDPNSSALPPTINPLEPGLGSAPAQQVQLNQSQLYNKFKSHCFVAYSLLRKPENSRLLISVFDLMGKSSLPDISSEPDRAIMFLENRLKVDVSDEMATKYFHSVINDSINALFPQVLETIHKWAQYWRN